MLTIVMPSHIENTVQFHMCDDVYCMRVYVRIIDMTIRPTLAAKPGTLNLVCRIVIEFVIISLVLNAVVSQQLGLLVCSRSGKHIPRTKTLIS